MPAVTKSSDLCPTPIDEQFNAGGDITAVIRREEQHGFRDFVRTSHSTHRHAGYEARLYLLDLFLSLYRAIEDQRIDRTRTDRVDSDLAVFQVDRPGASERSYSSLTRTVNTMRRVSFGSSDRSS
jgi:hypothetical protein